jgi:hypothetical protein
VQNYTNELRRKIERKGEHLFTMKFSSACAVFPTCGTERLMRIPRPFVRQYFLRSVQSVYRRPRGTDKWGTISGRGNGFFSSQNSDRIWGPLGTRVLTPGVKRWGRESGHSPPLSAESRMVELYLHSPYIFMEWCLIN